MQQAHGVVVRSGFGRASTRGQARTDNGEEEEGGCGW